MNQQNGNMNSILCSTFHHCPKERQIIKKLRSLGDGEVCLAVEGKLATVTLKNYEQRNSLTGKMMVELAEAVDQLELEQSCTGLVLKGEGGAFCSGANLQLARDFLVTSEHGGAMCELMTDTLTRLRRLPMVSVAAIEGAAVGGGAELTTACDFRIISRAAAVQFVQAKMGVSTGWGGAGRLVGLVGRREALKLLCWAPKLTAEQAKEIRLMDEVCEPGHAYNEAIEFLQPVLAAESPEAVRALKRAVASADDFSLDKSHIFEKQAFKSVWGGKHNRSKLTKS